MRTWPKRPLIYEINAWVWLDELSRREQRSLTLASVPDEQWDGIAESDVVSPAVNRLALGEHTGTERGPPFRV